MNRKCKVGVILSVCLFGIVFFACDSSAKKNNIGIDPRKVSADKPLSVAQLTKAFFAWKGKTVTVVGYCKFFFDKGSIKKRVQLVGTVGDKKSLVECRMVQSYDDEFSRTVPVVIKGTVTGNSYWGIELKDCTLISKGSIPKTSKADPYNSSPTEVLKVEDFYGSCNGWRGKLVSVIGRYWGTTTSTTSYGKTIRVDLQDSKNSSLKVGCVMKEKHPTITKRSGVIIKGNVSREVFGSVYMTNCVFVNR